MNNEYKTLDHLLAALRIPIKELKRRTGITVPRLREIYKECNPTQVELTSLFAALKPALADFIANGGQTGHFNQAGTNHTQNVTINVLVQITPPAPKPVTPKPRSPKAGTKPIPVQPQLSRHLPAGSNSSSFNSIGRMGAYTVTLLMLVVAVLGLIQQWSGSYSPQMTLSSFSDHLRTTAPGFLGMLSSAGGYCFCTLRVWT